ncbi:MAG: hypothetical protein ABEJ65_03305 [bacterium]
MQAVVTGILALLLMLGIVIYMRQEDASYEQIDEVMEEERQEVDSETDEQWKESLWEGKIDGVPVSMYRGYNRVVSIQIPEIFTGETRIDPYNFLRIMTRIYEELLRDRTRIKMNRGDPLDSFIIYSNEPQKIKTLLDHWNNVDCTELLRSFHHVILDDNGLKGEFNQQEINLDEIKKRASKLVELYKQIPDDSTSTRS